MEFTDENYERHQPENHEMNHYQTNFLDELYDAALKHNRRFFIHVTVSKDLDIENSIYLKDVISVIIDGAEVGNYGLERLALYKPSVCMVIINKKGVYEVLKYEDYPYERVWFNTIIDATDVLSNIVEVDI